MYGTEARIFGIFVHFECFYIALASGVGIWEAVVTISTKMMILA